MTRVRHLRKNSTRNERILWRHLRNRQLPGWKFRRQHPVDRYVLIFIAPTRALRLSSMVAATISRPKSRSIRHAQGFLRAKIFRFCDFGIMRSAKSWTASWKQFGATKKTLTLIISLCAKGEANACRRLRAKTDLNA